MGKSSLLNALTWACTGSTGDGVSGPKVVNTGLKKAAVDATFSDGRVINRTQSPNSLRMWDSTGDKAYDPKEFHKAFGCTWEVWTQTVHHAQDARLFLDLGPGERAQVLSDLLNLSLWEQLSTDARATARDADRLLREEENKKSRADGILESQLRVVEGLRREIAERDSWRTRAAAEFERRQGDLLNQITEAEKAYNDAQKNKGALELRLKRAESREKFLEEEAAAHLREANSVQAQHRALVESHAAVLKVEEQRLASLHLALVRAQDRVDEVKRHIREYHDLGATCPTCKQSISGEFKDRHFVELNQELDRVTEDWRHANDGHRLMEESVGMLRSVQEKERDSSLEGVAKTNETASAAHRATREAKEAHRELSLEWRRASDAAQSTESTLNALKSDLEVLRAGQDAVLEHGADLEAKLQTAENYFEGAKQAVEELAEGVKALEERVESYKFWGNHFLKLRLRLMEQALAELSLLSAPYLEQLGLEGWRLDFSTQQASASGSMQQKLEIEIFRPGDEDSIALGGCSGGERTRLRLAVQMALAASTVESQQFGFEIWDEPSAYLSGSGLEDLLEVLAQRAQSERKVIFLVDHNVPEFAFDGVLTLIKKQNEVTAQWTP